MNPLHIFITSPILAVLLVGAVVLADSKPVVAPYVQPEDLLVREVLKVNSVYDGDTADIDMMIVELGQVDFVAHNIRLRLKDVSCYEIKARPEDQSAEDRKVALMERDALAKRMFGAKHLTCRLYRHQTHDRYEAIFYDETGDINAMMRTYPQGGITAKK